MNGNGDSSDNGNITTGDDGTFMDVGGTSSDDNGAFTDTDGDSTDIGGFSTDVDGDFTDIRGPSTDVGDDTIDDDDTFKNADGSSTDGVGVSNDVGGTSTDDGSIPTDRIPSFMDTGDSTFTMRPSPATTPWQEGTSETGGEDKSIVCATAHAARAPSITASPVVPIDTSKRIKASNDGCGRDGSRPFAKASGRTSGVRPDASGTENVGDMAPSMSNVTASSIISPPCAL